MDYLADEGCEVPEGLTRLAMACATGPCQAMIWSLMPFTLSDTCHMHADEII